MSEAVLPESFITLDEAKRFVKRRSNDWDEMLIPLINFVVGEAELISGRKLMSRVYTADLHPGPDVQRRNSDTGHELKLKNYPATAVSAIRERQIDTGLTRTLLLTGLTILPGGFRIRVPNDFLWKQLYYEVDYTAGLLKGTHDSKIAALRGAGLRWLQVMWLDFDNMIGRGTGLTVGGDSITLIDKAMPDDIRMVFERMGRIL